MPSPRDPGTQLDVQAIQRIVTADYFKSLRLRIVDGRARRGSGARDLPLRRHDARRLEAS
jgi:hypothetical protein